MIDLTEKAFKERVMYLAIENGLIEGDENFGVVDACLFWLRSMGIVRATRWLSEQLNVIGNPDALVSNFIEQIDTLGYVVYKE